MWLSGLITGLQTERSRVGFPVRAQAWVAAGSLVGGCERQSMYLSHIDVSLPLSPSLSLSPKINE